MKIFLHTAITHNITRLVRVLLVVGISLGVIVSISAQSAYADGVVPESALTTYPGMDPRLVGAPIVKTDETAALVAYSQAVEHVKNLSTERTMMESRITMLTPELTRAATELKDRTEEYDEITNAYGLLVRAQYQEISQERSGDMNAQDETNSLRLSYQSAKVSDSLREWKVKANKKKKAAKKHHDKVAQTIAESRNRIDTIATELVAAKSAAKERKDVVRTGIPVASIVGLDIPVLSMDAYLRAERTMALEKPECGITWWALAGIGRAESNHGRYGGATLDGTGTVSPAIIGVPLNGNGVKAIPDTDQGRYDKDIEWDRAVGVMQFIPGTWNRWGSDGNGDGLNDPQNVYDGALAAAKYLCNAARPDMLTPDGRRAAFMAYNRKTSYVNFVETRGVEYDQQSGGRFSPNPAVPAQ